MARRKKLTFAKALAIANKGKAKYVKAGKVQSPPNFKVIKFPKMKY